MSETQLTAADKMREYQRERRAWLKRNSLCEVPVQLTIEQREAMKRLASHHNQTLTNILTMILSPSVNVVIERNRHIIDGESNGN